MYVWMLNELYVKISEILHNYVYNIVYNANDITIKLAHGSDT